MSFGEVEPEVGLLKLSYSALRSLKLLIFYNTNYNDLNVTYAIIVRYYLLSKNNHLPHTLLLQICYPKWIYYI